MYELQGQRCVNNNGEAPQHCAGTLMQRGLAGTRGRPCPPVAQHAQQAGWAWQAEQQKRLPVHRGPSRCEAGRARQLALLPGSSTAPQGRLALLLCQLAAGPAATLGPAAAAGHVGCGWQPLARGAAGGAGWLQTRARRNRQQGGWLRRPPRPPVRLPPLPPPPELPQPCRCHWAPPPARPPLPSAAHAGVQQRWVVLAGAPTPALLLRPPPAPASAAAAAGWARPGLPPSRGAAAPGRLPARRPGACRQRRRHRREGTSGAQRRRALPPAAPPAAVPACPAQ